ncbi:MAG TPA: NAD-dependent epimerase/dehydratase family protein [Tepidisphaeraceae bacterium]
MASRVFLTGGSGFVGSHILRELASHRHRVIPLLRTGSPFPPEAVECVRGDLFDPASLDVGMRDFDAVIHLVGIIMEKRSKGITFERIHVEGTRAVVEAAKRNGVTRYIHMSALGTRANAVSRYHQTKWEAEQIVRQSGLAWTIFRPGLIHGPGGFMKMEAAWARKAAPPFVAMPYFGKGSLGLGGSGLLQPVYVDDVARAFVEAIDRPQSIHKTYDLAGPDRLTWPQFHQAAARELVGRRRLTAPLPAWWAKLLASAGLGPMLGFNRDQVIMSQEDNVGEPTPFETDFGWKLRPFRDTLREYAPQLRQ